MRYFFHIGYNGSRYRGWQTQTGVSCVQQVIEEKLKLVFKKRIHILGCGRTDAQVHAIQYFFHADIEQEWNFDLNFRLNKMLPPDIAVFDIIPVDGRPSAQLAVKERTYDYLIHFHKDPFINEFSSYYQIVDLKMELMKKAAGLLLKYNDFRALCKSPDDYEHTICQVTGSKLFVGANGNQLRFQISANRFLNKMIRIIVFKLLETGTGKISLDEFENHLITGKPPKRLVMAYPQGLYLSKVTYPFLEILPKTDFFSFYQNNFTNYWTEL